jgi:hypothetical protein
MANEEAPLPEVVATERRRADRRAHADRRQRDIPVARERHGGQERRQGERRRLVDPSTCERDYNDDAIAFMKAMDLYKRANRRPFPTWSEVLEVLHALGYRRVARPTELHGNPVQAGDG